MAPKPSFAARALASLLALALTLAPGLARADQAPADRADVLLDEGTDLFTMQADYDGALQRFHESYRLRPSWKALNGIALVYQQQGKYVDAILAYEQLLSEFGATLSDGQMATVRRRLGELEKRVGVVVVKIPQEGAFVTIDGHEVGRGVAEVRERLLPGPHTLVATLELHQTLTRRIHARPGIEQPLEVELGAERIKVVVEKQPVRFEQRFAGWVPWATMGTGVGLALAGGALHYSAAQDFRDFDALVASQVQVGDMSKDVDDSLKRQGDIKQTTAVSLYAAGGAALATGLVLLFINRPRPAYGEARGARVVFGGTSVGLALDF